MSFSRGDKNINAHLITATSFHHIRIQHCIFNLSIGKLRVRMRLNNFQMEDAFQIINEKYGVDIFFLALGALQPRKLISKCSKRASYCRTSATQRTYHKNRYRSQALSGSAIQKSICCDVDNIIFFVILTMAYIADAFPSTQWDCVMRELFMLYAKSSAGFNCTLSMICCPPQQLKPR